MEGHATLQIVDLFNWEFFDPYQDEEGERGGGVVYRFDSCLGCG